MDFNCLSSTECHFRREEKKKKTLEGERKKRKSESESKSERESTNPRTVINVVCP